MAQPQLTANEKTLVVLEAAMDGARFSDIVRSTGLAKTTVHRTLQSLVQHGMVRVTEDDEYIPGTVALSWAARVFQRVDIAEYAHPVLVEVAERTGCQAHVGADNQTEAIYVAIQRSPHAYLMPPAVGNRMPLHSTSIGKVLLAQRSPAEFDRYCTQVGLAQVTPRTITDPAVLRQQIELVQERGFALDDEENVPGIRCVAAPIRSHLGRVTHAISLSSLALERSLDEVAALAPVVIEAASAISRNLGYTEARDDGTDLRHT